MNATSPITETVLSLVTAVGVGNFILIAVVLALIVNIPNIVSGLANFLKSSKASKTITDVVAQIQVLEELIKGTTSQTSANKDLINSQINEIKALVAIVDLLHSSLERDGSERKEEANMMTYSLERLSRALESIEKIMRNVMSEEDASALVAFMFGIEPSFKNKIIEKAMLIIEQVDSVVSIESLENDLKNDLYSEWSDFKTRISSFKTPIDIKEYLEKKEEDLWSEDGLFNEILKIVKRPVEEASKERKKDAIVKLLNIGLRRINYDLSASLRKR